MSTIRQNGWKNRLLAIAWSLIFFFAACGPLGAQEVEKEDTEPIWVISWAIFYLFLALTIILLSRPTKRQETLLNEEETKKYLEEFATKRSELNREEEEPEEDDD